jgi:hypothetical protein
MKFPQKLGPRYHFLSNAQGDYDLEGGGLIPSSGN